MRSLPVGAIAALLVCGTHALAQSNKDFSPPTAAELVSGFKLRDRYNLAKHIGATAIYVDSVSVHHLRSEASTIVWKDASGHWQRSQAVEIGPGGLLTIKRKLESNETRPLTAAEAEVVERLIADPNLYRNEVTRTGKLELGGWSHVMAIISPYGRTTIKWEGRLLGESGKIADVVLSQD
jgi:hypothetical protein